MRPLAFSMILLVSAWHVAHADTLADLNQPSSTIPGCSNDWTGVAIQNTCEAKAAVVKWQAQQNNIEMAETIVVSASDNPNAANKAQVIAALNSLATMADQITSTYHPAPPETDFYAGFLASTRFQFQQMKLPIPASLGDAFRYFVTILNNPIVLNADRNTAYDRASVVATGFNVATANTMGQIPGDVDQAVFRAHQAAIAAAKAAEYPGSVKYNPEAAEASIQSAAGPDYPDIAAGQVAILNASLASHPGQGGYVAQTSRGLSIIPANLIGMLVLCLFFAGLTFPHRKAISGTRSAVEGSLLFVGAAVGSWLPVAILGAFGVLTGLLAWVIWLALFGVLGVGGKRFLPERLREGWGAAFNAFGGGINRASSGTHGTAKWGTAKDAAAAHHVLPRAPEDGFALGWMRDAPRNVDARFRQGGHILTCAPSGAGKGIGGVIPNLLDYPGSAFVLDFKGENFAVTAAARAAVGHEVFVVDPFGVTGTRGHSMNWLDALDPKDPDVVGLAASLAEMLVVSSGNESDPHWDASAKELLRGMLIYVAGLPERERSMSCLRRIITGPEEDLKDVLAEMIAEPDQGQRIPARAANAFLNKPEKERGSVLSTLVRHTAWLDDPRLDAAFSHSDFSFMDLKRRKMTVYLVLPPDRLRACLGFVRGFISLALDATARVQGQPKHRVAFFLDEFGQLGHIASLADNITLIRGYGVQMWLFVQDLSQLKAVYPRWQSFLANTTQQYFGTADYDTAKYISDALGKYTIRYQTSSQNSKAGFALGGGSTGTGEHFQGRSLLTPDEVMRLGPMRPIVMISGEAPYLLDRINYLQDAAYVGRFDENPQHVLVAV